MSKMFENYDNLDPRYFPDNRHRFCFVDKSDEIVIGGTAVHIFKLNFKYSEYCKDLEVFYKQSITKVLEKTAKAENVSISEFEGFTVVEIKLLPEETARFKLHRDTFAQLKLYMKDGTIHYGEQNKIKMVSTLELSDTDSKEGDIDIMGTITSVELNGTRLVFKDDEGTTKLSVSLNPLVADQVKSAALVGKVIEFYNEDKVKTFGLNIESLVDMAKTGMQEKLVSGKNIKTINNVSLLGEGNVDVVTDLSNYYDKSEIDAQNANKVDKEPGNRLITAAEIAKLAELHNYDDEELKTAVADIEDKLITNVYKVTDQNVDELNSTGIYVMTGAIGAPGTETSGTLSVRALSDEYSEQEWISKNCRGYRINEKAEGSQFFVNGVATAADATGKVVLTAGGIYELKGELLGHVEIGATGVPENNLTKIVLNGVAIKSDTREAISFLSDGTDDTGKKAEGDLLVVEIKEDSENFLEVNTDDPYVEGPGTSDTGSLYSAADMIVNGTGYLSIRNNSGHGIKASDLTIAGLTHIYVDAVHDAFHGSGDLKVTGGTFYVKHANDAFSAGKKLEEGKTADKYLEVSGGNITVEKCEQNVFEAKESVLSGFVHGKTALKVVNSGDDIAKNVTLYDTITLVDTSVALTPFASMFGANPSVRNGDGELVEPVGTTYSLAAGDSYTIAGNFTGYNIIVGGTASSGTTLTSNGVYVKEEAKTGRPFIQYTTSGKNIQINTNDGKVTYIKTIEGGCLTSAKNVQIGKGGTLILECENGNAIDAVLGDTIVKGSGARYISSMNVNRLHVGEGAEDYAGKTNMETVTSANYNPTAQGAKTDVSKMNLYVDGETKLYARESTTGLASGMVIAIPQYIGCAILNKITNVTGKSRIVIINGKAFKKLAAPEDYRYEPVVYVKETELPNENAKTWIGVKEQASDQFPDIKKGSVAWMICYSAEYIEDNYANTAAFLAAIQKIESLRPKIATFDFTESNITATNINIYKHTEDTKPHTVKYYVDEEENIYARNSEDGGIMADGTGSICLSSVGLAENEVLSASIEGSYNKFKTPYTTLVDGIYKITKLTENISVKLNKISEADLEAWTVTYNISLPENYEGNAPIVTEYRCNDAMVADFMGKQLVFEDNKYVSKSYSKETGYPDKTTDDAAQINFKVEAELPEGYTMSVAIPAKTYKNFTKIGNTYQATKLKGDTVVNITIAPPVAVSYNAGDYSFSTTATEIPNSVGLGSDLVFAFYHQTNKQNPTSDATCIPDGASKQLPTAEACLNRIASITIDGENYTAKATDVTVTGKKATVKIPGDKVTGNVIVTLK